MKKIIVVAEHFTTGGAERVLSELILQWVNDGCDVITVQIRPDKYNDSYGLPGKVKNYNLFASSNRIIRRIQNTRDLIKVLKKNSDGIVVSFVEPAMLIVALAKPFIKNKVIFSERCDPDRNPPKKTMRFVRDLIFNIPDICVFQTEDARKHFSKKIQKKGVIIPNPVNPNIIPPYVGKRRKAIAFVGRFVPQKNIPLLLEAFSEFVKEFPDYTLEMYGRGFEEEEVCELIKKYNIESNVIIKGFCLDVHERIKDCAMFVSSSDYEGISNSMLEAMAIGLPVIVTDCPAGGAREVIKDHENGILIPVKNKKALLNAMKELVLDKNLASSISKNATNVRIKYPINIIANKWLEIM